MRGQRSGTEDRLEPARAKEMRRAKHQGSQGRKGAPQIFIWQIRGVQAQLAPKSLKRVRSAARIGRDDRGIDGADRDTRDKIRMNVPLLERLDDAALKGAKRAAALKDQHRLQSGLVEWEVAIGQPGLDGCEIGAVADQPACGLAFDEGLLEQKSAPQRVVLQIKDRKRLVFDG